MQNRFPPPPSKMQNFQTSLSQYPNFQTRYCGEYETNTEENQESGDDEVDLMIGLNLTNLSTEVGPTSPDVLKTTTDCIIVLERKYAGQYTWFYYNLAKYVYLCKICEVFYCDHPSPTGRGGG